MGRKTTRATTDGAAPDPRDFVRTATAGKRECETGMFLNSKAGARCAAWLAAAHDESEKSGTRIIATKAFQIIKEHLGYPLSYEGFKRHLNNLDRCCWKWREAL